MGALRFLLAVAVFATHAQQTPGLVMLDGRTAVNVFFVISGFLMQLVLRGKYTPQNDAHWQRSFYTARLRRLYPMYFTTVVVLIIVAVVIDLTRHHVIEPFAAIHGVRCLALLPWATMIGLNVPPSFLVPSGAFWTLGLEMGFYLISPWVLRWSASSIVILAAISAALRWFAYYSHLPIIPYLDFFLLGSLVFRSRALLAAPISYPVAVLAVIGIVLGGNYLPYQFYTTPVLAALMVPSLFAMQPPVLDSRLGDLSYPIYLSHEFALRTMAALWVPRPLWAWVSAAFATTLLFSFVLIHLDRPMWRGLGRIGRLVRRLGTTRANG